MGEINAIEKHAGTLAAHATGHKQVGIHFHVATNAWTVREWAPAALAVFLIGDFNGWNPQHTQLERSGAGMWTATIPLKPGRYQYMFVIDGKQWIADPLATEASGDGFGAENAVLDVSI